MAAEYREKLIETAVEQDDDAMEAYLEGNEPDEETLKRCIRKGTIAGAFVPVLLRLRLQEQGRAAAARRGCRLSAVADSTSARVKGVQDGRRAMKDERKTSDDEPFSALAFKIMNDPYVGSLTFVRVYSGKLETGT